MAESLVEADSLNQNAVGSVTFEPGARTKWHSHPAGQIILALDGEGYSQEKGSPKIIVKKGDVVKCPPNIFSILLLFGITPFPTFKQIG